MKQEIASPFPTRFVADSLDRAHLQIIQPLLEQGLHQLENGIHTLSAQYPDLPFDAQRLPILLFANLVGRVLPMVKRTFVLEFSVAHLRGRLSGETEEEQLQSYVHLLRQPQHLNTLLEEYKVLAHHLETSIKQWVSYSLEFLHHLCADWQELRRIFAPASNLEELVEIQAEQENTHQEGRSVLLLRFASGWQLVYKPRSLAIDVHFQEVLTWLNEHGQQPPLRTLKLLDRGGYGWSEFVTASSCQSEPELARFYQRLGAYLALLHTFGARDIHPEHLISAGEHPILVELGILLQPYRDDAYAFQHPAHQAFNQSVLSTGLFSMDLSPDYCDHFVTGFTNTCHLLACNEFLESVLPCLAHDEIPVLPRPSRTYIRLLTESFHPNHLRGTRQRDRNLDRLWLAVKEKPYLGHVIAAEQTDLQQGDIPLFTTYPDSRDLFTSRGERIVQFFVEPALNRVRRHLSQLNEEYITHQVRMIRGAFAGLAMTASPVMDGLLILPPAQTPPTSERLLRAACSVGERLDCLALHMDGATGWLGMGGMENRQEVKWVLQPASGDLYTGTAGITFFLAYLGQITSEIRYTTLARSALKTVRIEKEQRRKKLRSNTIGAFTGLGAFIYLFTHLGILWHESALLQEAQELVEFLPGLIEQDEKLDILAGSAGCIMSLLGLYAVAPSASILAAAVQCGEHLLAHARPQKEGVGWSTFAGMFPLTGFAHGAAGIAYSLLLLAEVSGQERFRDAALLALAYERYLFSPEKQNWPDLREVKDTGETIRPGPEFPYRRMWCSGAPGIGLARLASLPYLDDAQIREEIAAALKTTLAIGFGRNHSLCHGDLGNLETLLIATLRLDEQHYHEHFKHLTASLLESIETGKWVTGVPLGVETPGLMNGLAGIGYELLRLAEPEKVPSVLLLAPPAAPDHYSSTF